MKFLTGWPSIDEWSWCVPGKMSQVLSEDDSRELFLRRLVETNEAERIRVCLVGSSKFLDGVPAPRREVSSAKESFESILGLMSSEETDILVVQTDFEEEDRYFWSRCVPLLQNEVQGREKVVLVFSSPDKGRPDVFHYYSYNRLYTQHAEREGLKALRVEVRKSRTSMKTGWVYNLFCGEVR